VGYVSLNGSGIIPGTKTCSPPDVSAKATPGTAAINTASDRRSVMMRLAVRFFIISIHIWVGTR
jgi:hypothetical protein